MKKYIAEKKENKELNGVELYFAVYPLKGTKENLKKFGFRWNPKKGCWYAKKSAYADEMATICAETTFAEYEEIAKGTDETVKEVKKVVNLADYKKKKEAPKKTKKEEKKNKFGVKVGDFFSMSWGYEQTNVDFFQVVELVGTQSVRIRQVNPPIIESKAVGGMAEDRVYNLDTSVILPPSSHTVHIKDNEKGDLKRLKSWAADGISNPQINMSSYADAHYCNEKTEKAYVSWYY